VVVSYIVTSSDTTTQNVADSVLLSDPEAQSYSPQIKKSLNNYQYNIKITQKQQYLLVYIYTDINSKCLSSFFAFPADKTTTN